MTYELALKVVKSESNEQTARRIVELYDCIKKLEKLWGKVKNEMQKMRM
jgi:hypothetical protein